MTVIFRPFRPRLLLHIVSRGDVPRFARHLPRAFIFRAFGALVRVFVQSKVARLCTKSPFDINVPASPPDVRQGYALPDAYKNIGPGLRPRFGLCPNHSGPMKAG